MRVGVANPVAVTSHRIPLEWTLRPNGAYHLPKSTGIPELAASRRLRPRLALRVLAKASDRGCALSRRHLVLHCNSSPVARNRLVERHDLNARALRLTLALDRLVVDAYPGNTGADALPHHAAHSHDAAVTGVAVHDHRNRHAVGDPSGDRHALGHAGGVDI